MIEVETTAFGGGALARAATKGEGAQDWYVAPAVTATAWQSAAAAVTAEFRHIDWFGALAPAFSASGVAADRLARTAAAGGVVVTTGQQPGLFGGPLYTLSKALSALALADTLERTLGVPVAPVFWAATDDTDYAEASHTVVVHGRDVDVLAMDARVTTLPMARLPLGNVDALYDRLARAAGSVLDPAPLHAAREAYDPSRTVGDAYVTLLRGLLEPLGIAVLDAAHPAVRTAGAPVVRTALRRASDVAAALNARSGAITAAGYKTQVQIVPHLSLVFKAEGDERKRVPIKQGPQVADETDASLLGPNVLLRPVMERAILPTVTYVAGPGEYAYFAQVSAVASALGLAAPRVVPRWSGRLIEPHVREILDHLGVTADDFGDPHAVESRVARDELAPAVREALVTIRDTVAAQSRRLREQRGLSTSLQKATSGFELRVQHRIDRLERRYAAAVKREGSVRLHDVAVARASLYPNGIPQERALNAIPFLARYGSVVIDEMRAAARVHAEELVGAVHGAAREEPMQHAGRHG